MAIQRGPLVYCLESTDLPEPVKLTDIMVPQSVRWTPRREPKLLGGVVVLEGLLQARADPKWEGQLYRELAAPTAAPISIKLVPYFAWGNRGKSEMTVWLPLSR